MMLQNTFAINMIASVKVDAAALRTKRHIQHQTTQKNQTPLNSTDKRLAFYAHILVNNRLTLPEEEAEEWRELLPMAIEGQHFLISHVQ